MRIDYRTRRYILSSVLIILIALCVMYCSLKGSGEQIFTILKRLEFGKLGICFGAILLYHGIVGWILSVFARFYNPNYALKSGVKNALIAALFHGITPFASGGQFIQAYVFYEDQIDVGESASILLMDFIVYQTTLVCYSLICVVLNFEKFLNNRSALYSLALLGFAINFIMIVSIWLLSRSLKFHKWLCENGINIAYRLRLIKDKDETIAKINNYLDKFNKEVKRLSTKPKLILKVVCANIVRLSIFYSLPYLCAKALNIDWDLKMYFDSVALSSFISMINSFVPLPGASGGAEGSFVSLFSKYVPLEVATSIMLVWRFVTYYFVLIIGLIVYLRFKRNNKIRRIEEEIYENRSIY